MSIDESLELLSDEYARKILYTARDLDDPTHYEDLIDEISDRGLIEDHSEERFEIALAHNYLPRMAETGILDYDEQDETLHYVEDEQVEELLDCIEELEMRDIDSG